MTAASSPQTDNGLRGHGGAVPETCRTRSGAGTQSSAANMILGATTVALSGNPRLAVRAVLVLLQDGRSLNPYGRLHRRSRRSSH